MLKTAFIIVLNVKLNSWRRAYKQHVGTNHLSFFDVAMTVYWPLRFSQNY